ncbi:ATP synthase delta/epsilon chain alpha-helix domain-containing protein [Argonema antarcticum]|uniref:ATP synthase delta/epsilon chain alpha-helix domain-containing protein n=1 Tax=Argonema antarcticum TaxID=2942763 RepID=UPI003084539B
MESDRVTILVNGAEKSDTINLEAARTAYSQAQERYNQVQNSENRQEKIQATQAWKKARARFQAAGGMVQV